ncbi:MAG: crossover junction endodeoxyribonuclease RuvC [bacterium]
MTQVIRILGIDPALRSAGWGVIEAAGGKLRYIDSGVIKPPPSGTLAMRLHQLYLALDDILRRHHPDCAAVEETFVNSNPRAALTLGQARGICLVVPAKTGIEVSEYPANTIKKSVTGAGHADKQQIQAMIRMLLPKAGSQPADAADALAVAICHAHHMLTQSLTQRHSA